jgi:Uma2 family endonuclease
MSRFFTAEGAEERKGFVACFPSAFLCALCGKKNGERENADGHSSGAMMRLASGVGNLAHAELPSRPDEAHLMAMPATTRWTADMVRALPDDGERYEVIDGELFVTPSPSWRHQDAVLGMAIVLRSYVSTHRVGHVLVSPADVAFDDANLVQPDVFVTPLVGGRRPREWSDVKTLLLAVEVLSPNTARADRQVKLRLYQRQRVPEYWIVDVDARLIERWRPEDERPAILGERIEWHPDSAAPSLVIDLADYFREVLGE